MFCAYLVFYESPVDVARVTTFLGERIASDVVGFVHCFPNFATLAQRRTWFVEDLFVAPHARSRGVATTLLARAERLARETSAIRLTLTTAKANLAAQRVYERAGWKRENVFLTYERNVSPESASDA